MALAHSPSIVMNGLVLGLDAANKKSYSQNEFQYSTDIFGWCSSVALSACTISRDTVSSPVGNTPLKMSVTGNDPHIATYNTSTWNIAPAANGQTWVVSVYVKANVATTGEIVLFGANSSGVSFVGGAWLAISGAVVNITTEWTRVSHYITMANANIAFIHTRLDGPETGGTGQTIWWDGLQVERVPAGTTTPTPFTSSYYGGSVYRDLIGTNNGTLINYPTYSSVNGGTFSFDGTNDYVDCGNSAVFNQSGGKSFTITCWAKFNSTPAAHNPVFNKAATNGTFEYTLGLSSSGSVQWLTSSNGTSYINRDVGETISTGIWYYYAVGFNFNSQVSFASVNGKQIYTAAQTGIFNGSRAFEIGRHNDSTTTMNGNIAQVSIYNRALTAAEIQQNFNATRGRFGI